MVGVGIKTTQEWEGNGPLNSYSSIISGHYPLLLRPFNPITPILASFYPRPHCTPLESNYPALAQNYVKELIGIGEKLSRLHH